MVVDILQMDIDRLHNLAVNFGWEKTDEKREGNVVSVTYRKSIPAELLTPSTEIPPEVGEGT